MPPSRLNASTRKPALVGRPNDASVASPIRPTTSTDGGPQDAVTPTATSSTAPKIKLKFKTGANNGGSAAHASGDEATSSADERASLPTTNAQGQPLKLKLSLGGAKTTAPTPSPEPSTPKLKLSFSAPSVATGSAPDVSTDVAPPAPSIASSRMAPRPKARAGSVLGPSRGVASVGGSTGREKSVDGSGYTTSGEGPSGEAEAGDATSSIPKVTLKLPPSSIHIAAPIPVPVPAPVPITSATPVAPAPPTTNSTPKPKPPAKKPAKSRGKGWSAKRKVKPPIEYDAMGYPIGQGAEGYGYPAQYVPGGYAIPNAVAGSSAMGMATNGGTSKGEADELEGPARKRVKLSMEPKVEGDDGYGDGDGDGGDVDMVGGDPDDPYADAYEAPQAFVDSRFPSASVPPSGDDGDNPEDEERKPDINHEMSAPATPSQAYDAEGNDTRDPSRFGTPVGGSDSGVGGGGGTPGAMGGLEYGYNFTPGGPGDGMMMMEGRFKGARKPWMRIKKSLKEVMKKVIQDMKRKDGYGLFLDPVDPVEYPGYFEAIGGEHNAMDLATMEKRLDEGMYRSVDEFEADIETMISAAETFNAEDSLVAREASKMRILAKKHITRSRPIVRTPSPEPRGTPGMFSGAATPGAGDGDDFDRDPSASMPPGGRGARVTTLEVPLRQTIPEGMLDYPNNSDAARAVAFYMTGGQRIRGARERKGRERWDGQWREWNTEGDRNLREVDDVRELLRDGFLVDKLAMPERVDHQAEIMQAGSTWYPAPLLTGVQSDEVAPTIPTKAIRHTDLGPYGDMPLHYGFKESAACSEDDVRGKIRDELEKAVAIPSSETEDDHAVAAAMLRELATGSQLSGEAYLRSIERFIAGAVGGSGGPSPNVNKRKLEDPGTRERRLKKAKMESSASSDDEGADATVQGVEGVAAHIKTESLVVPDPAMVAIPAVMESIADTASRVTSDTPLDLGRYVRTEWRAGWLDNGPRKVIREAQEIYEAITAGDVKQESDTARETSIAAIDALISEPSLDGPSLESVVKASIRRVPVERELRLFSARKNGLDLSSLLTQQSDFAQPNSLGGPPSTGPGRHQWFVKALDIAGAQVVEASLRREQGLLADAKRAMSDQSKLKKLRLDLLALAKNVPVHELRPMTAAEAEKLPTAVRGLIKIVDSH